MSEAVRLYRLAVLQGYANAQYNLALCYQVTIRVHGTTSIMFVKYYLCEWLALSSRDSDTLRKKIEKATCAPHLLAAAYLSTSRHDILFFFEAQ